MSPIIRAAQAADFYQIHDIYRQAVLNGSASWEIEPPGRGELLRRFQAIVGAGYPYVVAEINGQVLGYAYASSYRPRPGYRFTVENTVYLDPKAQRLGAGQALMAEVISQCRAQGYKQMVAVIGDSQNHASINFHAKLGFKRVGLLPNLGHKHGRWLDSVMMQLAL